MQKLIKFHFPTPILSLIVLELLIFASLLLSLHHSASLLNVPFTGELNSQEIIILWGFTFCVMLSLGLYNRDFVFNTHATFRRGIWLIPLGGATLLALASFADFIGNGNLESNSRVAALELLAFVPVILCFRWLGSIILDISFLKRRVMFIGSDRLEQILTTSDTKKNRHFKVIGYVPFGNTTQQLGLPKLMDKDMLINVRTLLPTLIGYRIDEIIIATSDRRGMPVNQLLEARLQGYIITDIVTFLERETGELAIKYIKPSDLIFQEGFRLNILRTQVKRLFDVLVSLSFLLATFPIMILTAIAVKVTSPGPVFYRQERVGQLGRTFDVIKFRSMREDAEKDGKPQWAKSNDDRTTSIGNFIRRTRIDELPQILNVLYGDMSFIGPRPERPFFVEQLNKKIPYYSARHNVKPGITGWAQINYPYGATEEDAERKLGYDLYYIKNGSLLMDLMILLQTVRVVLFREGAR